MMNNLDVSNVKKIVLKFELIFFYKTGSPKWPLSLKIEKKDVTKILFYIKKIIKIWFMKHYYWVTKLCNIEVHLCVACTIEISARKCVKTHGSTTQDESWEWNL
jgi:hypothetical protein